MTDFLIFAKIIIDMLKNFFAKTHIISPASIKMVL